MLCNHISRTASCHDVFEPSTVRVSFGAANNAASVSGRYRPAVPCGVVGQRIAHHLEYRTIQVSDAGYREVALGAVDDIGGQK